MMSTSAGQSFLMVTVHLRQHHHRSRGTFFAGSISSMGAEPKLLFSLINFEQPIEIIQRQRASSVTPSEHSMGQQTIREWKVVLHSVQIESPNLVGLCWRGVVLEEHVNVVYGHIDAIEGPRYSSLIGKTNAWKQTRQDTPLKNSRGLERCRIELVTRANARRRVEQCPYAFFREHSRTQEISRKVRGF